MNQVELEQISRDAAASLVGLRFGKVYPHSELSISIDFFPHSGGYLFIDCDPGVRSAYLVTRRMKDLERSAAHASPFVISMRKLLSGRELRSIDKITETRVMVLDLSAVGESESEPMSLVVQLGGRRPNLFILDGEERVVCSARQSTEQGQTAGEKYEAPVEGSSDVRVRDTAGRPLSDVLDEEARTGEQATVFDDLAKAARKKISADIAKRRKLIANLEGDLSGQGDAAQWKRYGDLILANISDIRREGENLIVTDFYDPDQVRISIPAGNRSPTEAAESYFKRYAKARNGAVAITARMAITESEIERLEVQKQRIESAIESGDADYLTSVLPRPKAIPAASKKKVKHSDEFKGARRFISSDGLLILVGKKAMDNDYLTFRVARSLDLWLHAADYPGSHVVVRDPDRKGVPDRTLTEAAQLAAFYSDARAQPKAEVRYTQRKFVNKPKRSAPGMVSLASYKTILVEPQVSVKLEGEST